MVDPSNGVHYHSSETDHVQHDGYLCHMSDNLFPLEPDQEPGQELVSVPGCGHGLVGKDEPAAARGHRDVRSEYVHGLSDGTVHVDHSSATVLDPFRGLRRGLRNDGMSPVNPGQSIARQSEDQTRHPREVLSASQNKY